MTRKKNHRKRERAKGRGRESERASECRWNIMYTTNRVSVYVHFNKLDFGLRSTYFSGDINDNFASACYLRHQFRREGIKSNFARWLPNKFVSVDVPFCATKCNEANKGTSSCRSLTNKFGAYYQTYKTLLLLPLLLLRRNQLRFNPFSCEAEHVVTLDIFTEHIHFSLKRTNFHWNAFSIKLNIAIIVKVLSNSRDAGVCTACAHVCGSKRLPCAIYFVCRKL